MAKKKVTKMHTQRKWKAGNLLYKYRSLNALHFLIDIIRNQMLYAAQFTELNDPMEGMYRYSDNIPYRTREMVLEAKTEYRICALSKKKNSTLMWAHYADSHRGVVLGIKPRFLGKDFEEINVVYTTDLRVWGTSANAREIAKEALSKKLDLWKYEDEVRILTKKRFVPIKIEEVLIGCKAEDNEVERIKFLFERIVDRSKIKQLQRDELDVNMESW